MPDGKFPVAVIGGVPVVAAPAEIDITANGRSRQPTDGGALAEDQPVQPASG